MKNLSWEADEDAVKEFFKECGEIERVKLLTDRETGKSIGRGFVTFTTGAGAEKAVKLSETDFWGRNVYIEISSTKPAGGKDGKGKGKGPGFKPEGCKKIIVRGLPWETTEDDLWKLVEGKGDVEDLFHPTDRDTGSKKDFCMVTFSSTEDADKCMETEDAKVQGEAVRLCWDNRDAKGKGKGESKGKGKGDSKGKGKGDSKGKGKGKGKGKKGPSEAASKHHGSIVESKGSKMTFDDEDSD